MLSVSYTFPTCDRIRWYTDTCGCGEDYTDRYYSGHKKPDTLNTALTSVRVLVVASLPRSHYTYRSWCSYTAMNNETCNPDNSVSRQRAMAMADCYPVVDCLQGAIRGSHAGISRSLWIDNRPCFHSAWCCWNSSFASHASTHPPFRLHARRRGG